MNRFGNRSKGLWKDKKGLKQAFFVCPPKKPSLFFNVWSQQEMLLHFCEKWIMLKKLMIKVRGSKFAAFGGQKPGLTSTQSIVLSIEAYPKEAWAPF